MQDAVFAIQLFNKPDTCLTLLNSIKRVEGSDRSKLVILQDSPLGYREEQKAGGPHREVTLRVQDWLAQNGSHFRKVDFRSNDRNRGTCGTTQRLIDWAFDEGDLVIFSEDDTEFERDALAWFASAAQLDVYGSDSVWAVAGESKVFDTHGKELPPAEVERAREAVIAEDLLGKFHLLSFLPSTCFAVTGEKWQEFGQTRGKQNGDRDVNIRCREEGRQSIWPVVARVCDNGMHHPNGYSMMIHKDKGKIGDKASVVKSGDFPQSTAELSREKNIGSLFVRFAQQWEKSQGA